MDSKEKNPLDQLKRVLNICLIFTQYIFNSPECDYENDDDGFVKNSLFLFYALANIEKCFIHKPLFSKIFTKSYVLLNN